MKRKTQKTFVSEFEGLMYTIWTSLCVVEAYTIACLPNTS
jgi:hypothetical protein